MPDSDTSRPGSANTYSGTLHGTVLQARDIHGGVHLHPAPATGPQTDVCLDAPRPATGIRDRAELLAALESAMTGGDPRPHVLVGPGGIGKSTIAAALAERAGVQEREVFWVRPGSVAASLLEIAVELGGARSEAEALAGAPRRAARWAWRHLDAAPRPWLLVFDNADRPEELDAEYRPGEGVGWLRGSPRGTVVVTTRVAAPGVWAPAPMHSVAALDAEDAAAVLDDHAGTADSEGAVALARRLGGFPLALTLAGKVMAAHRTMFRDFRQLQRHLADSVTRIDELARPLPDGGATLAGTWEASVHALSDTPQAAPLLDLLSVLGPDGVEVPLRRLPVEVLRGGAVDAGPETLDEVVLARAINALVAHGLFTLTEVHDERALRVHPLIGETTRANLGERAAAVAGQAAEVLRTHQDRDPALEHAAWRAVAAVRSDALGEEHPDTLDAEVDRDRARMQRGDATGARPALVELVERTAGALGAEHRVPLRALHSLGDCLLQLDRLEEAAEVFAKELRVQERVHGPDDQATLSARHQVALTAGRRGDYDTAAEGFRAVLHVERSRRGPDDPTVLFARQNLAFIAMKRGAFDEAEREFGEALLQRRRLLGPEHPDTIEARYLLALNALERGDTETARAEFTEVLRLREAILGPEHPHTAQARERWEQAGGGR